MFFHQHFSNVYHYYIPLLLKIRIVFKVMTNDFNKLASSSCFFKVVPTLTYIYRSMQEIKETGGVFFWKKRSIVFCNVLVTET